MVDEYLLRYILEYLKKCKRCNRYDINNNGKLCCICGDFFCEDCKTNFESYRFKIQILLPFFQICFVLKVFHRGYL